MLVLSLNTFSSRLYSAWDVGNSSEEMPREPYLPWAAEPSRGSAPAPFPEGPRHRDRDPASYHDNQITPTTPVTGELE